MPRPYAGTTAVDRFWASVAQTDRCWNWVGYLSRGGYGRLRVDGRLVAAHRFSWELHNGPLPANNGPRSGWVCVLHACDNRRCVRPTHLFLGTYADNNRDAKAKGRAVPPTSRPGDRGDACPNGHSYAVVGYYRLKNGTRRCKECVRLHNARYFAVKH